jgi:osmotically-inducible protein OsmY
MKIKLWSGYLAKLGLGAGVAVVLGGTPVVAHAEDNMPSNAATNAGNAAERAGDTASGAANQAGNAASGAADQAGNAASNAAEKASDTANSAADRANNAADRANNAADKASDTASSAADKANRATEHGGAMADDSSITDAVKAKLTKAGNDTSDIKVDTDNGIVTLSGTVHDKSTREHAVHMAKKAKGVKSVKDNIEIAPTAK